MSQSRPPVWGCLRDPYRDDEVCAIDFQSQTSLGRPGHDVVVRGGILIACREQISTPMTVYFVNSGKYGDGRHNNSAKEWLAMPLRGKASPPKTFCNAQAAFVCSWQVDGIFLVWEPAH